MDGDSLVALWRGMNASLAMGALWMVLFLGVKPKFHQMTQEIQFMMMATLMLLFTAAFGSIEQAIQGTPFGFRTPFLTVALLWCIIAMTFFRDPPTKK